MRARPPGSIRHSDVLLRSLLNDQLDLLSDVHRLAAAFTGWGLDEILNLTRTERRRLVELVRTILAAGEFRDETGPSLDLPSALHHRGRSRRIIRAPVEDPFASVDADVPATDAFATESGSHREANVHHETFRLPNRRRTVDCNRLQRNASLIACGSEATADTHESGLNTSTRASSKKSGRKSEC